MRKSGRSCAKNTSYKTETNSEEEENEGDFVDSGSEASVHNEDESEDGSYVSSGDEFKEATPKTKKKTPKTKKRASPLLSNKMLKKAIELSNTIQISEQNTEDYISVKDLTEQEKLLPEFLNLSESGSDSDEGGNKTVYPKVTSDYKMFQNNEITPEPPQNSDSILQTDSDMYKVERLSDSDSDSQTVKKKDVTNFSATQTNRLNFENLYEHSKKIEEVRKSLKTYNKNRLESESKEKTLDVKSLLAMGESSTKKKKRPLQRKIINQSDSEDEFEEVEGETKHNVNIPKGGIQVVIDIPNARKEKKKSLDVEMMLKRRINRIKKEHQVFMHKVHVLCWIGHGNYLHKIISDMDIMGASLSLLPSEKSYPDNRINIKYTEQIVKWYSDFLQLKEDKNDLKFKFNKSHLKTILLQQISSKTFTTKKNKVLVFVSLLRALGIKCRLALSFFVVPMRPPATELCSLSMKKDKGSKEKSKNSGQKKSTTKPSVSKENLSKSTVNIPQLDGFDGDSCKTVSGKNKKDRKSSKNKKSTEENTCTPSTSDGQMSYWDRITRGTIKNNERRINHRDLVTSTSTSLVTATDVVNDKEVNKSTKNTAKNKSVNGDKNKSTKKKKNSNAESKSTKNDSDLSSPSKSQGKPRPSRSKSETSSYFNKSDVQTPQTSKKRKLEKQPDVKNKETNGTKKKSTKATTSEYFKDENQTLNRLKAVNKKRLDSNNSDTEFEPPKKKTVNNTSKIDRRVLSSDDECTADSKTKRGVDFWCEVYVEEEEQWISIDVIRGLVHCPEQIYNRATHPVSYVVVWDMNGYVKDVTRRYVPHWNTTTRKLRVDSRWYEAALRPWMAPAHLRDRNEDEQLDRLQLDAPIPQTVAELKNHPLYALKRHLLKFEVIYPSNAVILGFVRNEPVYARECVHICRSRETWVKEAKVVKPNEKPYKIVKARPKYDKLSGQVITDKPLEIFGPWQVEDYVPPEAEDGKVPRNPYGNVELFKPCMLPGGTVHLTLPGLNKVAKKLGIDCAPAMVGFDYHSGGSHPIYDGFVVCKEFEDTILAAWEQEQEEAENRAREKIEKRVYGNWRRLIRGLIIRKKLQAKYDFRLMTETEESSDSTTIKKGKK